MSEKTTENTLTSFVLDKNPLSKLADAFRQNDCQGASAALVTLAQSHKGEQYFSRIAERALFSLKKTHLDAALSAARVMDALPLSSSSAGNIGYGDYMRFLMTMSQREDDLRVRTGKGWQSRMNAALRDGAPK